MSIYRTKVQKLTGSDFHEVRRKAYQIYLTLKKKSKRKPYIRSLYFNKEKIFLDLFWSHLFEKRNFVDLMRRIKFYPCALELLKNSRFNPSTKENPNKKNELLHRFTGITLSGERFVVQVKEEKRNNKKYFISVFPQE